MDMFTRTRSIEEKIRGIAFKFRTKAGVFSKDKVDEGTKLLLEKFNIKKGDEVLDLGCGYGPMGIVAGKISGGKVTFVDSDIRAINLTKENIRENKILNSKTLISDGFLELEGRKFDLILTYPPSHEGQEIVEGFVKESVDHLKKEGQFYLVTEIRLRKYFERLFAKYFSNWEIVADSQKHILFRALN